MVEVTRVSPDSGASCAEAQQTEARSADASKRRVHIADRLAKVLAASSAEAKATGLTDHEIEAELAAYNSERRG